MKKKMPLFKHVRDDVVKYEDITRTEFKNATFYMYYMKDGKEAVKRLPYRATQSQLQAAIEAIRKDVNYYKRRQEKIDSGHFKVRSDETAFFVSDEEEVEK